MKTIITLLFVTVTEITCGQGKKDTLMQMSPSINFTGVAFSTGPITIDTPRKDDFYVNGIRLHHQANCSNCDMVVAMMAAGYNYDNGVFYRGNREPIKRRKHLKSHKK